jgi:23S rRNA (guanine2445-N2)-methyltransferase / 23S rRNA (guanine2069-N7)-methyltransferase
MRAMTNLPAQTISVTCPVELENALKRELDQLGVNVVRMGRGVAEVTADLDCAYRLVLWSRIANRVLLPIQTIPLVDEEQFHESMKAIAWENWCEAQSTFAIQWTLGGGDHHGQFFMYRLKDAICDRFKEKTGARPGIDTDRPDILFHLLLTGKEAMVFLDLGGGSLHKRGYRRDADGRHKAIAPLKENLAAALLTLADWHSDKYQLLLDPLCGSGTLLIEAALMRADIAPGLLRGALPNPGWLGHDMALWKQHWQQVQQRRDEAEAKRSAAEKLRPGQGELKKRLVGFDADRDAVAQAIVAADRAGVSAWIHFERRDISTLQEWPRWPQLRDAVARQSLRGLVITNPPYGERLGNADTVPYLYRALGRALQEMVPGWDLALLAGSKQQAEACGVKSREVHYRQRVHNGPIGCDFSVSTIAAPGITDESVGAGLVPAQGRPQGSPLQLPIVLQLDGERYDRAQQKFQTVEYKDSAMSSLALSLLNRLRKNAKNLQKWITQENIECYRLYDADIPELNVAIDIYRNHLHVQEYAPPATVDEAKAEQRFAIAKQTLEIIFPDAAGIHCKLRRKQKSGQQYKRHAEKQEFIEVQEGRAQLLVNLDDYLDTGLFLDHRPIRLRIEKESRDKRFLNLFCYTGAATMHAAVGGAKSSVSVDLSPAYTQWARSNLALNGFSESTHRIVQADILAWLPACREQFDLIFVDPPTFSNSKRTSNDFDVQEDHAEMIDLLMKRLEPGGTLYFSNNFRRFVLDEELAARYRVKEITDQTIPLDFKKPGKPIHRCWEIKRN